MSVKRTPADIAFSKAIRESHDYTCCKCGTSYRHDPGYIDCAHVHTRLHRNTRWCAEWGAVALCKPCHRHFTLFPLFWAEFLTEKFGEDWYEEAKRRAWETKKYTKADQADIAKHYRAEVSRIEKLRLDGETGHIPLVSYD